MKRSSVPTCAPTAASLTDDMEGSVPGLVAVAAAVCGMEKPPTICAKQVCSSKKVTDHHAIVPTISAEKVDMASAAGRTRGAEAG